MYRWLGPLLALVMASSVTRAADLEGDVQATTRWWPGGSNLFCRLVVPTDPNQQKLLQCFENKSNGFEIEPGEKLFEYKTFWEPVSLYPLHGGDDALLLSTWESGSAGCFVAVAKWEGTYQVVVEDCSKGGIEILFGREDQQVLIVSSYEWILPKNGTERQLMPARATVYCYIKHTVHSHEVVWEERLAWTAKYCVH